MLKAFHLDAPTGLGRHPRPELIAPLLQELPGTLQDTVRMGFLHSSHATGRISDALKAAADIRFVRVEAYGATGTSVLFEAPRFGDAAPSLYAQGRMWDDTPPAGATAFDLLANALQDIDARRADSPHFDQPLLKHIGGYDRLLKRGLTRIALADTLPDLAAIDAELVRRAQALAHSTPVPRRVRVTGRLDLMGASQGVLKLHLRPGEIVTALWNGPQTIETHREWFNRDVVIEGLGVFRASGSLLRIEADALEPAVVQDNFFRQLPVAVPLAHDHLAAARLRPGEKSAFAAIRGAIPAEESDDDFAAAVDDFS